MTQQKQYQPKVGDLVRVLVDRDRCGDKIDTSRYHVIGMIYTSYSERYGGLRKFIGLKLPNNEIFECEDYWEVTIDDVEPVQPPDTSHTTHSGPLTSELDAVVNDLRALLERVERLRARVASGGGDDQSQ